LATAIALKDSFASLYPVNSQQNHYLGTSIGRYPEDIYDGYGMSVGNPWFLATAAYSELYSLAIMEWQQLGICVNEINRDFFNRMMKVNDGCYEPDSKTVKQLMKYAREEANKFLATIQYHQANNGSMSEQFDRYIGFMAGARDLTWSHAAFISASKARAGSPIY
jgi:glucoamylase